MSYDNKEKNPFFIPALIMTLIIPAGIAFGEFFEVFLFMFVTPFAAFILSFVGLVIAKKLHARYIGCVFCFVLSILETLFVLWVPAYLSKPISVPSGYTIQAHTYSSSEAERINEEMHRKKKKKPARRNEK